MPQNIHNIISVYRGNQTRHINTLCGYLERVVQGLEVLYKIAIAQELLYGRVRDKEPTLLSVTQQFTN